MLLKRLPVYMVHTASEGIARTVQPVFSEMVDMRGSVQNLIQWLLYQICVHKLTVCICTCTVAAVIATVDCYCTISTEVPYTYSAYLLSMNGLQQHLDKAV